MGLRAPKTTQRQVPLHRGKPDSLEWKFYNGKHVLVITNKWGDAKQAVGVVAALDDDTYALCALNDFASYTTDNSLEAAKLRVEALFNLAHGDKRLEDVVEDD